MFYKVYQNLSCMHVCMYACMHVCIYEQKDGLFLGLWCSGRNLINYRILPKLWKTPEYSNKNEYSIRAEMIISIFCLHFFRGRPGDFLCSAWRRWCNIMAQGGQLWPQTYKNWKGKHKKIFKQNTKHKKGKTVVGPFESYHMHTTTGHLHLKLAKSRTKCNCWE